MDRVVAGGTGYPHRLGEAVVTVLGADGRPVADADVVVRQTGHAFGFGNIGFDFVAVANGSGTDADARLAEQWLELFNTATLPFYWRDFEPVPGAPRTDELLATARWFADRGIRLKGHPLMWHTAQPRWLLGRPLDEIEQLQRGRIRREVTGFRGLIGTWDAINEAVIMPVFTAEDNAITPLALAKGRIATVRLAFEEARAADAEATLLINDFDLSSAYECLIEGLLEAGIKIDAIGLQTHMHQGFRGEEPLRGIADRFARYGLPLHFTETSLVSGDLMPPEIVDLNDYVVDDWPSTPDGEARQADELVRHYRTLVGHPAVQAITYWGITDAGAWLGAPIGLVRADGTPKPAYDALKSLVKGEWWLAPSTVRTDADGRLAVRGFAGDYQVADGPSVAAFDLVAGTSTEAAVRLVS